MKLENLTGKFYLFWSKELFEGKEGLYPDYIATMINFDKLEDSDKEAIITSMDFKINKNAIRENPEESFEEDLGKPCWKLVDTQGANLGGIEADEFDIGDYDSMMDRLDIYYNDYGYYFAHEVINLLNVEYKILEELEDI